MLTGDQVINVTPPSTVIRVVPDAAAAQPNPAVQIRS